MCITYFDYIDIIYHIKYKSKSVTDTWYKTNINLWRCYRHFRPHHRISTSTSINAHHSFLRHIVFGCREQHPHITAPCEKDAVKQNNNCISWRKNAPTFHQGKIHLFSSRLQSGSFFFRALICLHCIGMEKIWISLQLLYADLLFRMCRYSFEASVDEM